MAARKCPFELLRSTDQPDESKKDAFASFEVPLNPDDPDNTVTIHKKVLCLQSIDPEDTLILIREFNRLADAKYNKNGKTKKIKQESESVNHIQEHNSDNFSEDSLNAIYEEQAI